MRHTIKYFKYGLKYLDASAIDIFWSGPGADKERAALWLWLDTTFGKEFVLPWNNTASHEWNLHFPNDTNNSALVLFKTTWQDAKTFQS
jgi:hypothetical protein